MLEILGFAGVIIVVFVPMAIRFEHRITRIEDKIDVFLNHNGLNPADCVRKSKGRTKDA